MKRTALGTLLGLAILGLVTAAPAQPPSDSARPGRALGRPAGNPAPGASAGHAHQHPGMTAPPGSGAPGASGHHGHHGGPPDRPSLHKRMMERLATMKARRDTRVGQLRARFSELHLRSEPLRNELRRHARSVAFLTRARMIAEEELSEPKKAKVLKRIDVLLAKEQARHDRHVAKFTTAGPSGSAPPFASGVVPPASPSGVAASAASGAPKRKPPTAPAASAGGSL